MKTWDTIIFGHDLDMLECRLTELDSWVDRFVISEARLDHQGNVKPLHYMENRERFAAWSDRVIPVIAELPDTPPDPRAASGYGPNWDREVAQRQAIGPVLAAAGAAADDVILHGDVDEIPRRPDQPVTSPRGFSQVMCYFAVDWVSPAQPWQGTTAFPYRDVKSPWHMRWSRHSWPSCGTGWHFTWLGGPDVIRQKLSYTPHGEESFLEFMRVGNEASLLWERGWAPDWQDGVVAGSMQCRDVDVDETWPRWIYERRCPAVWFRPRP